MCIFKMIRQMPQLGAHDILMYVTALQDGGLYPPYDVMQLN